MPEVVDMRKLAKAYMGGLAHVHTRLSNHPGHRESDQTMVSFVGELVAHGLAGGPEAPFGYVMFNDHASDPARPRRLGRYSLRARALLRARRQLRVLGVPVVHGLEASLLPGGETDLTPQLAKQCAVVIASRHALPAGSERDPAVIRAMFEAACWSERVDVLGHPLRNIEGIRGLNWGPMHKLAAKTGTAVEVNLNTFPDPAAEPGRYGFWQEWLAELGQSGAKVYVGTDLHNEAQLARFRRDWSDLDNPAPNNKLAACLRAMVAAGIGPERVVTSSYERLNDWLALSKPERAA